jgi:uncharacterized protein
VNGPLVLPIGELARHLAQRQAVRRRVPGEHVRVVDAEVAEGAPVDVDVELESVHAGIVVTGRVAAPWTGTCRRCLGPVGGRLDAAVRELYSASVGGDDAFALEGDRLDLRPLVREALALELPLAPLCQPDCAGLCPECGANRNDGDCGHDSGPIDDRWAALSELTGLGGLAELDRPDR